MVKSIYIIKNNINNKVYIGQSINPRQRWSAHCSNAHCLVQWSAIDLAMNKLGIENFYYEILEETENYDERECYWIKFYNSRLPYGYNCAPGEKSSGVGIEASCACIKSSETLEQIVSDLMIGEKSQVEIAKKYNVSHKIISTINRGTTYRIPGITYPIRQKIRDLSTKKVNRIKTDLKSNKYLEPELAVKHRCSLSAIQKINRGKVFFDKNENYPLLTGNGHLRKINEKDFSDIVGEL